jgi:hypothetical protein
MSAAQPRDVWSSLVAQSPFKQRQFGAGDPNFLFIGGERSGKTSLQWAVGGKSGDPPPTLALNYQSVPVTFGGKTTIHMWELGSGMQLERILDTIVTDETRPGFTVFICLNLMSPMSVSDGLEWLRHVPERFPNGERPIFLIGTHYDEFEKKDPRYRELITRGLRAIAAQNGAGICFTSTRSEMLVTRFKSLIKIVAFVGSKLKEKSVDVTGPIIAGPGEDPEAQADTEAVAAMMNQVNQDASVERERSPKETSNPAENPQFAEEEIDALRAARRKELADARSAPK